MIVEKEVALDDVLSGHEIDMVAEAIAEYITDQTGYCVKSFSVGLSITADLDDHTDEAD